MKKKIRVTTVHKTVPVSAQYLPTSVLAQPTPMTSNKSSFFQEKYLRKGVLYLARLGPQLLQRPLEIRDLFAASLLQLHHAFIEPPYLLENETYACNRNVDERREGKGMKTKGNQNSARSRVVPPHFGTAAGEQ